MVDLRRVREVVEKSLDIPEELHKPKGKLALAFTILSMEAGMSLEDLADVKEVLLWDNQRFEIRLFPKVDQGKRAKWKAALARPVPLNSVLRRLSK